LSLPYVCPELIFVKSSFCIKVGGKDRVHTGQQRRPGAIAAGKEVERAAKNSLSCQALLVSHGKPIAFAETGWVIRQDRLGTNIGKALNLSKHAHQTSQVGLSNEWSKYSGSALIRQ